jgi:Serine dehydrogenase proteinase
LPLLLSAGQNQVGERHRKVSTLSKEPSSDAAAPVDPTDSAADILPAPTRTPFYQAIHAQRYQRQELIKEIQILTGTKLVCYVAGLQTIINRDDTIAFVDLLHNISNQHDLDVLLHTGGGDTDAADKLMSMARARIGTKRLRIVVPDYAKSAGTMMVLGADAVVMSDSSELGPIDPQIVRTDHNGNRVRHSVHNYIDAYKEHSEILAKDPNNVAARVMLSQLSPETVKLFEAVLDRARDQAEVMLRRGMFKESGLWSATVHELLDTKRFRTHGQMINWQDAQDSRLGLTVEYVDPDSELWRKIWRLYCLQRLALSSAPENPGAQKLFESDYASMMIDSSAA